MSTVWVHAPGASKKQSIQKRDKKLINNDVGKLKSQAGSVITSYPLIRIFT